MDELITRQGTPADLAACLAVESACYPPEEAASEERIAQRLEKFPQGFLVGEKDGRIVGLINGAATHSEDIAGEEFKDLVGHDPKGANLVVFSLAVHPDWQSQGMAGKLMRAYRNLARQQSRRKFLLICKEDLIPLYEHLGFNYMAPSTSTHGGANWHEMCLIP